MNIHIFSNNKSSRSVLELIDKYAEERKNKNIIITPNQMQGIGIYLCQMEEQRPKGYIILKNLNDILHCFVYQKQYVMGLTFDLYMFDIGLDEHETICPRISQERLDKIRETIKKIIH